jgi:hypothetical protein
MSKTLHPVPKIFKKRMYGRMFLTLSLASMLLLCLVKLEAKTPPPAVQTNWTVLKDSADVKISYQIETCNGTDWVLVKVENNSNDAVFVSWDDNLSSGSSSFSSAGVSNYNREIDLAATHSEQGDCSVNGSAQRALLLPLDLFLSSSYTLSSLTYSISNFSIIKH